MSYLPKTDRRTTLKWMLAGIGTAPLVAACGGADGPASSSALLGEAGPISGTPYGADPDMLAPAVTWSRTMTPAQLNLVAALSDAGARRVGLLCPGALPYDVVAALKEADPAFEIADATDALDATAFTVGGCHVWPECR